MNMKEVEKEFPVGKTLIFTKAVSSVILGTIAEISGSAEFHNKTQGHSGTGICISTCSYFLGQQHGLWFNPHVLKDCTEPLAKEKAVFSVAGKHSTVSEEIYQHMKSLDFQGELGELSWSKDFKPGEMVYGIRRYEKLKDIALVRKDNSSKEYLYFVPWLFGIVVNPEII